MRKMFTAVATVLFVGAIAWLGAYSFRPPQAGRGELAPTRFSGTRALAVVRVLARAPRPMGSPWERQARAYLVAQFSALGLHPQVQTATAVAGGGQRVAGTVHNIVARLPGSASTGAVLLVAHYDSMPATPGAADDASGVAAVVEAARALCAGPSLRNDVVFLLTDGEEHGMLGARAFLRSPPARTVGLVLDLDNPGSSGPSLMYETSPGNGLLVREFARVAPSPFASSLMYEVARHETVESDFSVFRQAGFAGMSLAYNEGFYRMHTGLDTVQRVSVDSLQHQGATAVALADQFGGLDLGRLTAGDAVYFNVLGPVFVVYSQGWAVPLAVLVAVLYAAVVALGFRRRLLAWRSLVYGFVAAVVTMLFTAGIVAYTWLVTSTAYAGRGFPDLSSYNDGLHRAGLMALVLAVVAGFYLGSLEGSRVWAFALGAQFWWLLAAVVSAIWAPGASYLPAWPLLFSLVATAVVFVFLAPRDGAEGVRRPLARWMVLCVGVTPGILLVSSSAYLLLASAGLRLPGAVLAAWMLLALLVPLLELAAYPRRWLLPLALAAFGLAVLLGLSPATGYERGLGRADSLFYKLDADKNRAIWGSLDPGTDAWTGSFLGADPLHLWVPDYFPGVGIAEYYTQQARSVGLPPPELRTLSDHVSGGLRMVSLRVRSPRGAPVVAVMVQSVVGYLSATVDRLPVPGADTDVLGNTIFRWVMEYYDLPPRGIVLTLTCRAGTELQIRLIDYSYGLPGSPELTVAPRPPGVLLGGAGDATFVQRTFLVGAAGPAGSPPPPARPLPYRATL